MIDRQSEIRRSVAFKGAIDIHAAILQHTGSSHFDRPQLVRSVSDLTRCFLDILEAEPNGQKK